MKGLVRKDLLNLRSQMRIYLFLLVVWGALSFMQKSPAFFTGVLAMFPILLPMTALSYDEAAGWDSYCLTMPFTRSQVVLSRYILSWAITAACFVLSTIVLIACGSPFMTALGESVPTASLSLLFFAVIMPLLTRFGVEKARTLFMIVVLLPVVATFALSGLDLPIDAVLDAALLHWLLLPIALAGTALSFAITLSIYRKKEF